MKLVRINDSGERRYGVASSAVRDRLRGLSASIATIMIAAVLVPPAQAGTDVLTYHNDNARTGQNLSEQVLNPSIFSSSSFGKLYELSVDGKVDAQPLIKTQVAIPGHGTRNVLYVVTENDSVYALDADDGSMLWKVSVLGAGEVPSDDRGCGQITPEIGITSTPVIDPSAGANGTIYLVAMSKDIMAGNYFQRIHALDITSGAEEFGGPLTVMATFPTLNNGQTTFDPKQYAERAALLLLGGTVYTAWTSHCDSPPYTGWVISYSGSTLARASVLNVTPNGSEGSIWQSGAGLAADSLGNIYALDANGTFDTTFDPNGFPINGDFGNAFLKLSTSGSLQVADYFATYNTVAESNADEDLGSGGTLVLPDSDMGGKSLVVGAGKDGNIYLADRTNMGKFNPSTSPSPNANIYQELPGALPGGEWGMPAYFNKTLYYGGVGTTLKAWGFSQARLAASASSSTSESFAYPGTTPSISANGSTNGIVWAVENGNISGVLHAYDAGDLTNELYNSNQAPNGTDHFVDNKFITPTIANGRVYVGTPNSVAVFGIFHAAFFNGEVSDGNDIYQLQLVDGNFFGYYSDQFYPWLYHFGLGFEYVFDAKDTARGVYLYDPELGAFLYTNPNDFPWLWDFVTSSWLWYEAGTSRWFYDTGGRGWFFSSN
ncbi:MAG: PQQ-binding-like beta-propeller repeat protein [Candidatus Binataceae bacterium]